MSQEESNSEQELRKREIELRERELAVRMRELDAEVEAKQRAKEAESAQSSAPEPAKRSRKGSPLIQWINIVGFFLLGLAVVILALQYRFLILLLVIFGVLGFIAYKLFWDKS